MKILKIKNYQRNRRDKQYKSSIEVSNILENKNFQKIDRLMYHLTSLDYYYINNMKNLFWYMSRTATRINLMRDTIIKRVQKILEIENDKV